MTESSTLVLQEGKSLYKETYVASSGTGKHFKKYEVETAEQWKMNARAQDKELSGHQDILDSQGSWQV